jgi:tetratricopeptide (TPR) repeat protein
VTAFTVAVCLAMPPASVAAQQVPPRAVQETLNRVAADLFSATPRPADAIEELRAILSDHPELAEGHMLLGIAYRAQGSPEMMSEAVGELRQAIALKPSLLMARLALARVYLDLARQSRARDELEDALEEAPGRPEVLSLLGEVERQLENPRRSVELNRQALQADATFMQARYYLGLALLDLRQHADAIRELEAVAQSGVNPGEAYLALGTAYVEGKRIQEGLKALREAARLDPSRPEAHIQLARAYRVAGQLDEALQQLKLAMPAAGDSLSTLYRSIQSDLYMEEGLIRVQQGQLDAAADAFERVLALDAGHEPAKLQLSAIRKHRPGKAPPKKP